MVFNRKQLILPLLFLCLWACSRQVEDVSELQSYLQKENNGLMKTKKHGPLEMTVTYRPADLLIAQELDGKTFAKEKADSLRSHYDRYAYFLLQLSAGGKDLENYSVWGQQGYGAGIQRLAFGMNNKVHLLTNLQDTIPVGDYLYQRTFGVGASSDLLFVFNRDQLKDSESFKFVLQDFGLNTGKQQFHFKTADIKATPTINFEN